MHSLRFKPIKTEKVVISIRIDSNELEIISRLSEQTDISRSEFIIQCIRFALKYFD